jgi:hypothetical protein
MNGRSFTFHILRCNKKDWNVIENFKTKSDCEFLCACKDNRQIMGYVRFTYTKPQTTVENYFEKRAIVLIDKKNDEYFRELYMNEKNYIEYDKRAVVASEETEAKKDDLIKHLIENQTMLTKHMMDNQTVMTKQIADICMTIAKNNPISEASVQTNSHNTITNNNNSNNNTTNNNVKFNLKFFLNEQCKDAMDITEFAKTIPIGLDDVMMFKSLGHTEAVTKIIEKAYNGMEITKRPIHCTDAKRETMYVKNENKWTNDETKALTEKAIDTVANRSFRHLSLWKTANPDHSESEDKKTEYAVLVKQLLGGTSERASSENKRKIIRNLTRITYLDRSEVV